MTMRKSIKTIEAVKAYSVIKDAKLTRMEEAEQFTLISSIRALRKASDDYMELAKDAQEKLRPEDFEGLQERARRFGSLTGEEKARVNRELSEYNDKVEKCLRPEGAKMLDIEMEPLSRDAMGRFAKSNDFTVETLMDLYGILCE